MLVNRQIPLTDHDLIKINIKKHYVEGYYNVAFFEDNGYQIAYMQVFDLTGYGETRQEAKSLLDISIDEYLTELFKLKPDAIIRELKKIGFKQHAIYKQEISKDVHVDKEGVLKNFSLPADTKVELQTMGV